MLSNLSARVAELVDAGDSKSPAARLAGSIPASGTTLISLSNWMFVVNVGAAVWTVFSRMVSQVHVSFMFCSTS